MAYVALKPCCFAGQNFKVGETIPDELVSPDATDRLIKMSLIASHKPQNEAVSGENTEKGTNTLIPINIDVEDGKLALELTLEGLQQVFDVMCSNVTKASSIIKSMTDVDALILIDVSDSRKSIKEVTQSRGKELADNG